MAVAYQPATAPGVALAVRNLSKVYEVRSAPEPHWVSLLLPRYISPANRLEHWVLRDVSFEVARGRKLALVGENGSGKSTLLKILARLINPTAGEVAVHGSVLPLLELGAGFHPDLTGYENVFLQASILGLPRAEIRRRLGEIAAFSELGDFLETPVKYYSSGMIARLAFSVAIHCTPDILLVDEILSVGDPDFQDKSFNKMMEFVGQGRTLILVSHSLYAVKEICDDAIWLDEGRIREAGPAREVLGNYMKWMGERAAPFDQRRLEGRAAGKVVAEPPPCRIAGVRFLDTRGEATGRAVSQAPLTVEIDCEAERAVEDAGCRVRFFTPEGRAALEIDSFLQGERLALRAGRNTLRIEVDSLVARQATYRIVAQVLYRPPEHREAVLDEAETALAVENPDGVATNYLLHTNWSFALEERPC